MILFVSLTSFFVAIPRMDAAWGNQNPHFSRKKRARNGAPDRYNIMGSRAAGQTQVMNTRESNADAADRFRAIAERFCSVVDAAPNMDRTDVLVRMYRILPELIGEAIRLPDVTLSNENDQPDEQAACEPRASVRMNDEQWRQIYNSLKEKLGDWDGYMQVFDPTTDKEAIFGTLADDIADIYRDLREGLVLRQREETPPEEIIWNWRLLYYSHWGKHAIDALLTIHFRLRDMLE